MSTQRLLEYISPLLADPKATIEVNEDDPLLTTEEKAALRKLTLQDIKVIAWCLHGHADEIRGCIGSPVRTP